MFCKNCGNELKEDETFCPKCSKAVNSLPQGRPNNTVTAYRKKRFLILSAVVAVVILTVTGLICNSKPYLYASAISCFEKGNYARAEKKLSRILNYKDSEVLLAKCQYAHACECADNGDYDQALELIRAYEASSTGKKSSWESIALCKEKIASGYRSQERYEKAIKLYQELGKVWETAEVFAAMDDYVQAIELTETYNCDEEQQNIRQSWYRAQAVFCASEKNYDEALKYLKTYKGDYDEELCRCAYQTASFFMDNKNYGDAVQIAEMLKNDMEEAGALLNECYEAWGISYVKEEKYEAAWDCFSKCEVSEAGRPSLYATGRYHMEKGLYPEAHAIWKALKDYEDSAQQLAECCRKQGEALEQTGEYEAAIAMYEESGDADLVTRCMYNWAASAYEQYEYKLAMEKFTLLGDYEDSAERAIYCRYLWGLSAHKDGDDKLALQIFTELGDYENSAEKVSILKKRERMKDLDGVWKTDDGYIKIESFICQSDDWDVAMYFHLAKREVYNYNESYYLKCGINARILFDEGDQTNLRNKVICVYRNDDLDYRNGILYLGYRSFPCTVKENTMTLKMDGKTFTLSK